MTRKLLICTCAAIFLCLAGFSVADNGPADMILQATKDKAKKPKPAVFPHKAHQDKLSCAECHHSAKDGAQVAYVEGQEIQKCETCHYKGSGMPEKLETFKDAAHQNCRECHKQVVKDNPDLKEKFKGCLPCHPKDA